MLGFQAALLIFLDYFKDIQISCFREICFYVSISKLIKKLQSSEKNALANIANIALRLPTDSEQVLHDKVEDVFVVTQKAIYSFRLPDRLIKKTPFKLVLCAMYNSTFISSGKLHFFTSSSVYFFYSYY